MDFIFLIKWIKIDGLEVLRRADAVDIADKLSVVTFFWMYTPFVYSAVEEHPIGWEDHRECYAMLHNAQQELLATDPEVGLSHKTADGFLSEVKSLFLFYGGNPAIVNIERRFQ